MPNPDAIRRSMPMGGNVSPRDLRDWFLAKDVSGPVPTRALAMRDRVACAYPREIMAIAADRFQRLTKNSSAKIRITQLTMGRSKRFVIWATRTRTVRANTVRGVLLEAAFGNWTAAPRYLLKLDHFGERR